MRRGVSLGVFLVSLALPAGVFARVLPADHVYSVPSVGVRFSLPSDWNGGPTSGAHGMWFDANGPASVASMQVYAGGTSVGLDSIRLRLPKLVAAEYAKLHPKVGIHAATVGGTPAMRVTVRYHGAWNSGVGDITHVLDFVVHGGMLYEFDYMSVAPWTAKYLPLFAQTEQSVTFIQVA